MSSGSQTNMLRWRQKATPTQAQIEAAADNLPTWAHCYKNPTEVTLPSRYELLEAAEKILTAAAEAGGLDTTGWLPEPELPGGHVTAAAEVGDINPRTGPDAAHPSPLMSDEAARMLAEAIKQLAQAISSTARGGYAGSGLAGPPGDPADSNY